MSDLSAIASQIVEMAIPEQVLNYAAQTDNLSTPSPQPEQTQNAPLSTPEPIQPFVEPKPKHAGGRPCKFCQNQEEYLAKSRKYLAECENLDKPKIPYLNELAIILRVNREAIWEWRQNEAEHGEFANILKALETIQEFRLQQRIMGRYNPSGAMFLLKTKHGYIETEKRLLGGDKANGPLEIRIVEEKRNVE